MGAVNQENGCHFCSWLKDKCEKLRGILKDFGYTAKKLAEDDPRRVIHSIKVGIAITLVSLFYYFEPLYEGFGVSAMWAVLTVVVVFEYSVGATLGKGVNRVVATIFGGLLGVGAHRIACLWEDKVEPIILGLFVFLQEFGVEYFRTTGGGISDEKKESMEEFRAVLVSKNIEDSLVNFANWEPRNGWFRYRHPWTQYQKIGNLARHCACIIDVLNDYLHAESQARKEVKSRFEEICTRMSSESGKALKELSWAINTMTQPPSSTKSHIEASKLAAKDLNSTLGMRFWKDNEFSEVMPVATVASLLVDVVASAEKIAESVHELATLANFKSPEDAKVAPNEKPKLTKQGTLMPRWPSKGADHVVAIEGLSSPCFPKCKDPPSLTMVQQSGE
ncbi:hypothetical protein Ancab_007485 [Ancistrocladus abbreviatus]